MPATIEFPAGLRPVPYALDAAAPASAAARAARADDRIVRRLAVRLTTPLGSVPLARGLGVPPEIVDAPASAVPLLRLAVAAAVRPERAVALRAVRAVPAADGSVSVAVHFDRA